MSAESLSIAPPAAQFDFAGHQAVEADFLRILTSGRVPQGLLVVGPYGVGKATFAFRIARALLAGRLVPAGVPEVDMFGDIIAPPPPDLQVSADHPVSRRITAGAHGDLLVIERPLADDGVRRKGDVPVDLIRKIPSFLQKTASEEGWRVVIVDDADRMNRSAQNAILKILEEPPKQAMLILVAQSASALLPTIRSRCQMLRLGPLGDDQLDHQIKQWQPAMMAEDVALVRDLAGGSLGRAAEIIAADGLALWQKIDQIVLGNGAPRELIKLAESLARVDSAQATLVVDMVRAALYRRLRDRVGTLSSDHDALVLDWTVAVWEKLGTDLVLAQRRYLDLKPVFYRLFKETRQVWASLTLG